MKSVDLVGNRFGKLVVTAKSVNRHKHKNAILWVCECDCGNKKEYRSETINKGVQSCGCARGAKPGQNSLGRGVFVQRCMDVHGDTYIYDKVDYKDAHTKVEIECREHGVFSQAPYHHLEGRGCRKCGAKRVSVAKSGSTSEFVAKATTLYGTKYDYSNVEYSLCTKHVQIKCNDCGSIFDQTPTQHLSGAGCFKCGSVAAGLSLRSSTHEFVAKAEKRHGDKYDYSAVCYTRAEDKVDIRCRNCDKWFSQKANTHLIGKGCPFCPRFGFNSALPGVFYVLSCGDITKVGISNKSAKSRAKLIGKSFGSEFTVIKEYKLEGVVCDWLEDSILDELRKVYETPTMRFDGYTESFYSVDRDKLYARIEELIKDRYG